MLYTDNVYRYTVYINKMLTHSQTMLYARATKFIFDTFSIYCKIYSENMNMYDISMPDDNDGDGDGDDNDGDDE